MPYALIREEQPRLLRVKYTGGVTLQVRKSAVDDVEAAVNEEGFRRVLVDMREAHPCLESPADEANFSTILSENAALKLCRIAYLLNRTQGFNDFIEIIASARGYKFGHFSEEARAIEWLLDSEG